MSVVLYHPVPRATCSHAGVVYACDEDGAVEVPDAAAVELAAHGFTREPPEPPAPPPAPVQPRRRKQQQG